MHLNTHVAICLIIFSTRGLTSSGTALMLVNPLRKTTNTLLAPHLSADVAQSNAVSPAPSTITLPCRDGNIDLQAHIPEEEIVKWE